MLMVKKQQKNQRGFSVFELVILIALAALIGGMAWYVGHRNKPATKTENTSTTSQPPANSKIPADWIQYENKDLGFKFAYPKDWKLEEAPIEIVSEVSLRSPIFQFQLSDDGIPGGHTTSYPVYFYLAFATNITPASLVRDETTFKNCSSEKFINDNNIKGFITFAGQFGEDKDQVDTMQITANACANNVDAQKLTISLTQNNKKYQVWGGVTRSLETQDSFSKSRLQKLRDYQDALVILKTFKTF